MANKTGKYQGETTRLLSNRLWAGCPIGQLKQHEVDGVFFFDDFINTPTMSAASGAAGPYAAYIDTGNTITQLATHSGGVLSITTDATDNDEAWIASGGNTGTMVGLDGTAGATYNKKLFFECRIRVANVADSQKNIFIGLAEEGRAVADSITDAGALGDFDFFGFNQPEADGNGLDATYQKATQAIQVKIADMVTLVADTWYKVGCRFDPEAPAAKRITYYKDNVEQTTYGTAANMAAATFPGAEELALTAGFKNGAAAAHSFLIDWWAVAQLY
jgi:hypothetical protein